MILYSDVLTFYTSGLFTISDNNLDFFYWHDPINPKPSNEQIEQWKISYPNDIALVNCKNKAKQLISLCDWSVLPDVQIENKQDFIIYRSKLRELILNPIENPIFPSEPQPIWIQ